MQHEAMVTVGMTRGERDDLEAIAQELKLSVSNIIRLALSLAAPGFGSSAYWPQRSWSPARSEKAQQVLARRTPEARAQALHEELARMDADLQAEFERLTQG